MSFNTLPPVEVSSIPDLTPKITLENANTETAILALGAVGEAEASTQTIIFERFKQATRHTKSEEFENFNLFETPSNILDIAFSDANLERGEPRLSSEGLEVSASALSSSEGPVIVASKDDANSPTSSLIFDRTSPPISQSSLTPSLDHKARLEVAEERATRKARSESIMLTCFICVELVKLPHLFLTTYIQNYFLYFTTLKI